MKLLFRSELIQQLRNIQTRCSNMAERHTDDEHAVYAVTHPQMKALYLDMATLAVSILSIDDALAREVLSVEDYLAKK